MNLETLKRTLSALAMLTLATPAVAQPVTTPSEATAAPDRMTAALGVEILDPERALDVAEVRAAIGGELAVRIVDASAFAPTLGRLEIAVAEGVVRIAYHPAPGTVIERTLALPIGAADRLQLIAFVATNLVRDQATEAIAAIPPRPAPAAPVVRAPTRFMPVSVGFVPPLSVDRIAGERVTIGVGINALVGIAEGGAFVNISGLLDRKRGDVAGAQIGGLAASAGRLTGAAQIGGLAAHAGQVDGGVQIGGLAAVSQGDVNGAQLGGLVTYARGAANGVQIGGLANVARSVHGAQIAGLANVGGDVDGVQIGLVNVARKMNGVQVGLVNLSEDGDGAIPIGLINYSKNGQLSVDSWIDSSRVASLGFRHGTKHVQNTWAVGWSPDYDHVLVGVGLGIHRELTQSLGLDVDAMSWITNVWNNDMGKIDQLRATISVPVAKGVEVFGGVAGNVYISDVMDESAAFHPVSELTYHPTDSTTVVIWPSAFAGVRLRAR